MSDFDSQLLLQALLATGERLGTFSDSQPTVIVIGGSAAGLLNSQLRSPRATTDCDVVWSSPRDNWSSIEVAAREVATQLGLPQKWLNHDAAFYAWALPVGWRERCVAVHHAGPLEILCLSRFDLIASKILGAAARPHDLEDLRQMRPTLDELNSASEHFDRLESEDLDRKSYDTQRKIIDYLRRML